MTLSVHRLPALVLGSAALLVAAATAPAIAKTKTLAPPGNSAIGQYVETVPTASGGRPTNTIHPGGGGGRPGIGGSGGGASGSGGGSSAVGTGSSVIPAATLNALAAQGPDGRAAAALASQAAPDVFRGQSDIPAGTGNAAATGGSALSAILSAFTGSSGGGGLGVALPVILGVCVLIAGAFVLLRRRRAS